MKNENEKKMNKIFSLILESDLFEKKIHKKFSKKISIFSIEFFFLQIFTR